MADDKKVVTKDDQYHQDPLVKFLEGHGEKKAADLRVKELEKASVNSPAAEQAD